MVATNKSAVAALVFDRIAAEYDSIFTFTHVGRSQRNVVWRRALATFSSGSHILELNCGTGEDALFLAKSGMRVTACDASAGMIRQARNRMAAENPDAAIQFFELATENLCALPQDHRIHGVFSNFSGLNCVRDIGNIAQQLAERVEPGARLLLCLSTRYCLWEIAYYMLRANWRKALRRCSGSAQARVGDLELTVFYPTLAELRAAFAPWFRLRSVVGVGIAVPPSYLESWIAAHPRLLVLLELIDSVVRTWPGARLLGDHMLLQLERV
jgi:ubiquinone/menaquinone biosynthesis C-methylase UbiE